MTYLVRFEGSFTTKEEAIAFANLIEGIKSKFVVETRPEFESAFEVRRSLQVWESTHDEEVPKPCTLLTSINFNDVEKEHDIDGIVPDIACVLPTSVAEAVTAKVQLDKGMLDAGN